MPRATPKEDFFGILILFGFLIFVGGGTGIAIVAFAIVAGVVIVVIGGLFDTRTKPRRVTTRRLRTIPKAAKPVKIEPLPPEPTREEKLEKSSRIREREMARAATETDDLLRDIQVAAAERRHRERVFVIEEE